MLITCQIFGFHLFYIVQFDYNAILAYTIQVEFCVPGEGSPFISVLRMMVIFF